MIDLKKYAAAILWIIAAVTIIVSALVFKGSEYENTWLYVFGFWLVAIPLFELYLKKKTTPKD